MGGGKRRPQSSSSGAGPFWWVLCSGGCKEKGGLVGLADAPAGFYLVAGQHGVQSYIQIGPAHLEHCLLVRSYYTEGLHCMGLSIFWYLFMAE